MQQIEWQEKFGIGVEIIDQAHHNLFSIVQKITDLYVERHEDTFAWVEGIKYFKAYTFKHFAEEEAYMREIGYPGYQAHKRLHDRMKWKTLPELEQILNASNFSTEAVQRFIGVCTGWLTGHIIIEDQAITGKRPWELPSIALSDELTVIHEVILSPLKEIFGCSIQFVGPFSTKDEIVNAQYYALTYTGQKGQSLRVILVMGEQMLLRAAGLMFGMDFYEMNEIVCFAMQELAQNLIQRAAASFGRHPDEFQLEQGCFLEHDEFCEMFRERSPQYSLLFRIKQESFAVCIDLDSGNTPPEA